MRSPLPQGLSLLLFAGLAAFAAPASAAWPNSPFTNLAVCTAAGTKSVPAAVTDGAGGMLLAWADDRSGTNDLYAQHVGATGALDPAWPAQGLTVCAATGAQTGVVMVPDGAGGFLAAWQDLRSGSSHVYAQRVLAAGAVDPAWPAGGLAVCTATGNQQALAIVTDGAGGAIVLWQDDRSGNYDVYAQRVLAAGTADPAWPADGMVLCNATGLQQQPKAVPDGAGGAVVAWTDSRTGGINDLYAGHVLATGVADPAWPANGRALCTATGAQQGAAVAADGAGGAIVAWQDNRSGVDDIYAQHVLASGAVDGDWTSNGTALCTAVNAQQLPAIASDGAGGAIVAWQDSRGAGADIYAQHVNARGDVDAAWPADGRALCVATGDQTASVALPDGAGGAVVAWTDDRTGIDDVYAAHVLASGAADPVWPADGRAVSTASLFQLSPSLVPDDNGGVLVAWRDFRNGRYDVYAQRIGAFGYLGTPEPEIAGVTDVPNDEGGAVKVSWTASYLDQQSNPELDFYDVLRSVPAGLVAGLRARGARVLAIGAAPAGLRPGDLVAQPTATATYYWELLATLTARHYLGGYSYIAPTLQDSIPGSNPTTAFMVVGRNSATTMYWTSRPGAGYSVDNLAPAAPAPFTGQYAAGTTYLHWNPNTEADLVGYRLYRGAAAGFVPDAGSLVAELPDTGYADAAGAPSYYELTAVDVHGNESPVATLSPAGTTDVGGAGSPRAYLALSGPQPARGGVGLRFGLAAPGRGRLALLDAAGRRVRTLVSGTLEAGEHAAAWDGRDDDGRALPPGLYFARFEAPGFVAARRVVLVH